MPKLCSYLLWSLSLPSIWFFSIGDKRRKTGEQPRRSGSVQSLQPVASSGALIIVLQSISEYYSRELGSCNNPRPRLKTWERPRCRRFSLKKLFIESSHRRCWEQVRVTPAALVESLPCKSSQLTHTLFWAPELLNWDLDKVAFQKGDLRDKHISKNLIWDV